MNGWLTNIHRDSNIRVAECIISFGADPEVRQADNFVFGGTQFRRKGTYLLVSKQIRQKKIFPLSTREDHLILPGQEIARQYIIINGACTGRQGDARYTD